MFRTLFTAKTEIERAKINEKQLAGWMDSTIILYVIMKNNFPMMLKR